jgi:hypothetical protein
MKKLAILTSILVLTACGGGSGGGHNVPGEVIAPMDSLSAEQRAAAIASNAEITGMNSFVIVGGNNPTVNTNARNAHGGTKLHDGGVRYDLSNVNLRTTTFNDDYINPDDGAKIVFHIKNGEIVKLGLVGPEVFGEKGLVGSRNKKTELFDGTATLSFKNEVYEKWDNGEEHQVFDKDGNPVYEIVTETVDFGLTYQGFGNDFAKNEKLQYADFGQLIISDTEGESKEYFAGGYRVKKINLDDAKVEIAKEMNFTGIADARVSGKEYKRVLENGNSIEQDIPKSMNLRDNAAQLTLATDGTSKLNANFSNWYDVSVDFDKSGKVAGIVFDNPADGVDKDLLFSTWDKDENGGYKTDINYHQTHVAKKQQYIANSDTLDDTNVIRNGFVEYYGDNDSPAEAVGTLKYAESGGSAYMDHFVGQDGTTRDIFKHKEIMFNMGFGVKRD